jgi:hypothetical protein
MNDFFKDLFDAFPPSEWRFYEQKALKICIPFTNNTDAPRDMPEYRNGFNGKSEVDPQTGKLKQLMPGESRWIAIEPSSKSWGAAAYPKKMDEAKVIWTRLNKTQVHDTLSRINSNGLKIPYRQISDTLFTLFGKKVATKTIKETLERDGSLKAIHRGIIIVKSNAKVIGHLIDNKITFIKKHPIFPMGYGAIPIKKGCLIVIDLTKTLRLKEGNDIVKYHLDGKDYTANVIARIIDAPAVKGAMWVEMQSQPVACLRRLQTSARAVLEGETA